MVLPHHRPPIICKKQLKINTTYTYSALYSQALAILNEKRIDAGSIPSIMCIKAVCQRYLVSAADGRIVLFC